MGVSNILIMVVIFIVIATEVSALRPYKQILVFHRQICCISGQATVPMLSFHQ